MLDEQRPLFGRDAADAEDAARCGRDLFTVLDQIVGIQSIGLCRAGIEHRANQAPGAREHGFRWLVGQPRRQLVIGGAPGLDAAAPREAEDQLAFRLRDAAFGPRHLNDRHERQQTDGVGREAKVEQLLEELRVLEPGLASEVLARLLGGSGDAELLDQLAVLLSEVVVLERASALGKRHHDRAFTGLREISRRGSILTP